VPRKPGQRFGTRYRVNQQVPATEDTRIQQSGFYVRTQMQVYL